MNTLDTAWNMLATAQEYIQDCDNMMGDPIDPQGQLENLATAQQYIDKATAEIEAARYALLKIKVKAAQSFSRLYQR